MSLEEPDNATAGTGSVAPGDGDTRAAGTSPSS